jgi:mannose-6-phosphate isomerase-like protein (cupin superfamily)
MESCALSTVEQKQPIDAGEAWEVVDVEQVVAQLGEVDVAYKELMRVPSLSAGVYRLAAGSRDMQGPHDDDEVYFVLSGRARVRMDGDVRDVRPGSLLYVRAATDHTFFEIEEDITLLVLFTNA